MAQPELSPAETALSWLDQQPPRRLQVYGAALLAGMVALGVISMGDYPANTIAQAPGTEQIAPAPTPPPEVFVQNP
jgi:hypothetical protein